MNKVELLCVCGRKLIEEYPDGSLAIRARPLFITPNRECKVKCHKCDCVSDVPIDVLAGVLLVFLEGQAASKFIFHRRSTRMTVSIGTVIDREKHSKLECAQGI